VEEEARVILVDANLLVYAFDAQAAQHRAARTWLEASLAGTARVGLPWESLVAFLRITTNPRLGRHPAPIAHAWRQVESWLESPVAWVPVATERHAEAFGTLLALVGASANDVHDVHLAAIALQHGLIVATTDRDFARFPGLRWENPLAA
jgi:hypothetical protein